MGLFSIFRRGVDLDSYLRQTKKVRVNGVNFEIKKIKIDDHLAGLKVILSLDALYKREKPTDKTAMLEDGVKTQKFMRDFIYAGVASPKLTMQSPAEPGTIHVDDLTANLDLAQKLCIEIIKHAYGKKN